MWKWLTEKGIDGLVRERDVNGLTQLIRIGDELKPQIREYLACVIADLLTGKRKFRRRRPKKIGLQSEKQKIRLKVLEALKSQGHKLPIELINGKSRLVRGKHSLKVATVAKELRRSRTR